MEILCCHAPLQARSNLSAAENMFTPIRAVLERLNDHKKKYSVTDVCWRHVGSYEYNTNKINEKETLLFDLADLESVNGDKSFVDDLMDIFTKISCSDEWCAPKSQVFTGVEHSNSTI